MASRTSTHPDRLFHHPDPIRTPSRERIFMGFAIGGVLVGLPAMLGALFHYVLPWLGHVWVR